METPQDSKKLHRLDRHRANIASRQKEMDSERLFRRLKKPFFRRRFIRHGLRSLRYDGSEGFCLNNHEICPKIYRLTFLGAQSLL